MQPDRRQEIKESIADESERFSPGDVEVFETDDGLSGRIAPEKARDALRREVAAGSEHINPDDVDVS